MRIREGCAEEEGGGVKQKQVTDRRAATEKLVYQWT
jgi:hypothetical protein